MKPERPPASMKADPDRPPCPPECKGEDHPRCKGHNGLRQWCAVYPIAGARVCRNHGGATKQVKAAAKARLEEQAAVSAVARWALPVEINPSDALLQEVHRSAGMVMWLESQVVRVAGDTPDNLIRGTRSIKKTVGRTAEGPVDYVATDVGPMVNLWLDLFMKERDHLRKVCTDALKAGIAERQVQLAEQAGERAGQWLRASLEVLKLSDEDMRQVMAAGVRHLHLLEGGAA